MEVAGELVEGVEGGEPALGALGERTRRHPGGNGRRDADP
jgi:hypothetical protein